MCCVCVDCISSDWLPQRDAVAQIPSIKSFWNIPTNSSHMAAERVNDQATKYGRLNIRFPEILYDGRQLLAIWTVAPSCCKNPYFFSLPHTFKKWCQNLFTLSLWIREEDVSDYSYCADSTLYSISIRSNGTQFNMHMPGIICRHVLVSTWPLSNYNMYKISYP
jgi:hypothetical protein